MEVSPPSSAERLGASVAGVAFLQSTSLCKDLPATALTVLYEKAELVQYAPGEVIVAEGSQDGALYVLVEGYVGLRRGVGDAHLHLADLERPAVFGETAALTEQPHVASAISATECTLVRIPGHVVRAIATAVPKFGKRLALVMAARAKKTERKAPDGRSRGENLERSS